MQSIFEAIKKYPMEFMATVSSRAGTTPSEVNRRNHTALQAAIQTQNWEKVKELIQNPAYYAALNGVVYCLENYTGIEIKEWCSICSLMDNNKII